jgi:alpha-L-fucosidase
MDRTGWFREAKFGLFVHWGAYSVAGIEASWPIMMPEWFPKVKISEGEYSLLPQKFNPTRFDAMSWVRMAKQAGMRYIVFTSKHHDGFCMFDSPGTQYKITRTPYGRDVVGELSEACRMENIPLGLYYSPPDMHHPYYRDVSKPPSKNWLGEPSRKEWPLYLNYMEAQLRHLLTAYGPIAIIWFDGLFKPQIFDPPRFHKLIHTLSPNTLINDRLGLPGDYITPEQFVPKGIPIKRKKPPPQAPDLVLDVLLEGLKLLTFDQLIEYGSKLLAGSIPTAPFPAPDEFQLWETCMTMNNSWGFNPSDKKFKPARTLIRNLVEVASRGGNFLLNVGPTPEGTIQSEFLERLQRVGEWMRINAESIYGTTYGPLQDVSFARTTAKGGVTYLHIFDWPGATIELKGSPGKVTEVTLLAGGKPLGFRQSGGWLRIDLPKEAPDPDVSVLAIRCGTPSA